jgi:hypothetical protein
MQRETWCVADYEVLEKLYTGYASKGEILTQNYHTFPSLLRANQGVDPIQSWSRLLTLSNRSPS